MSRGEGRRWSTLAGLFWRQTCTVMLLGCQLAGWIDLQNQVKMSNRVNNRFNASVNNYFRKMVQGWIDSRLRNWNATFARKDPVPDHLLTRVSVRNPWVISNASYLFSSAFTDRQARDFDLSLFCRLEVPWDMIYAHQMGYRLNFYNWDTKLNFSARFHVIISKAYNKMSIRVSRKRSTLQNRYFLRRFYKSILLSSHKNMKSYSHRICFAGYCGCFQHD